MEGGSRKTKADKGIYSFSKTGAASANG